MDKNLNSYNTINGITPPDFAKTSSNFENTVNNRLSSISEGVDLISGGVNETLNILGSGVKTKRNTWFGLRYVFDVILFIIQNIGPIITLTLICIIVYYGYQAYKWIESVYNSIKSFLGYRTILELENQNMKKEKEELAEKLSQTQQKLRQAQINPGLL
jgi:hypothetical protein